MKSTLLEFIRKLEQSESQLQGSRYPAVDWSRLLPPLTFQQGWRIFWRFIDERYMHLPTTLLPKLKLLRQCLSKSTRRKAASQFEPLRGSFRQRMRIRNGKTKRVAGLLTLMKKRHARIKTRLNKQLQRLNHRLAVDQQNAVSNQDVRRFFREMVKERERELFSLSIVRVDRWSASQATLNLDPCLKKSELLVGWSALNNLLSDEDLTKLTYPSSQLSNKLAWCHSCRIFQPSELTRTCSYRSKIGTNSSLGAVSNPFSHLYVMYSSNVNNGHNYYYPYLQYRNEGKEEICGRVYCNNCLPATNVRQQFICPYCNGLCMCDRCAISDSIAKYQSQYIKAGGTLAELMEDSIIYCQWSCHTNSPQPIQPKIEEREQYPPPSTTTVQTIPPDQSHMQTSQSSAALQRECKQLLLQTTATCQLIED